MKTVLASILSLAAFAGVAAPVGIPYNVSCTGAQTATGAKLTLTTDHKPGFTLVRETEGATKVDFQVQRVNQVGGNFTLSSVGNVAFAGSGSLTGDLSVKHGSGVGTWKETTRYFDESTGQTVVSTAEYRVKCSIAQ